MRARRFKLIFNPAAGLGRRRTPFFGWFTGAAQVSEQNGERVLERVLRCFELRKVDVDVHVLGKDDDAGDIAAACGRDEYDAVVVAGGDGTVNRVVQGVAGRGVPVGIIPAGSINVLALELGLPFDIEQACERIVNGQVRDMDLGKMGDRFFACMVGVGVDAEIIKHTTERMKRIFGLLSFGVVACWKGVTHSFRPIDCKCDGQEKVQRAYFMLVSNAQYYAGAYKVSGQAAVDDGLLDIVLLKKRGLWQLICFVWHLTRGKLDAFAGVDHVQATSVKVCGDALHHVHVDAEYIGEQQVEIAVVPGGLRVIV